jgi:hypothetical protein
MEPFQYIRVKCSLTGVEFPLFDAFVLDVFEAERRLAVRRQEVALLEQLVAKLGASTAADGAPLRKRAVVSPVLARAFDAGVTSGLLVPLAQQRDQRTMALIDRLRRDPFYGPRLAKVPSEELPAVVELGRRLRRCVDPQGRLSPDGKTAIGIGAALTLRGRILEDCTLALVSHAITGTLPEIGVAPGACPEVGPAILASLGQPPPEPAPIEAE